MSVTEKRTELYVGLFVFVGLAVMAVLILQFGRFEDRLKEKYPLQVTFSDATGIFAGVDVRLGGVKIGVVDGKPRANPNLNGVIVDLQIFNDFKIPRNGKFSIRTSGLMGDSYVGIQIPDAAIGGFLEPGEIIAGARSGDLEALTLTAEELTKQAKELLTEVTETVQDIRSGVDNLNSALKKFDDDILGDDNLENVKAAIANLRETSGTLSEASTKLGPLLDEAKGAIGNASDTFAGTQKIVDQLGPVVADFEAAAEGAAATVEKINRGDGLLAAILNDPVLKEDFTALLANLRNHGVLRYKDSAGTEGEDPPSSGSGSSVKTRSFFKKQ